ncbi:glutamine synthetase family protein [Permianibacter aggregans]|uniref:Glutamate--putrescine ligase n=1 Tax=Permianibacter aggregans TaxID=1510150 RepID=A0A4R6UUV4_9GAMM|nr:glutamine synthetase family protein [Permianibacter aggregans]QGX41361.1 glutamine synthetase [Permianibacter aggregans]TDQ51148.1 glutamate--putrescine ligase [Permianibacter aggregans]
MFDEKAIKEAETFLQQHPEVTGVDMFVCDTNGVPRGKRVDKDSLLKAYKSGVALPGSIFSLDITGDNIEEAGLGFDIGDADQICWPIPGTLKVSPWQKRPMAQVQLTMTDGKGAPFFADPRQVLSRVLNRFKELKLTPVVAVELEFYVIDRQRINTYTPQPPISPFTGLREESTQVYAIQDLDDFDELLEDLADAIEIQDLPADTAVAEYAPGQYEINLEHRADALRACDDAFLLKRLIKGVTLNHNVEATFMAKPYDDRAGSGMHIHVSLIDENGRNVFATAEGDLSDTLKHALGGLMATMREAMAIFAPNANSYRRFRTNSFVPNCPAWGVNNRSVSLRIPAGSADAMRVEHRVAGADANPYLAVASVLAGIHHGITKQLDCGPETIGNAYTQHKRTLPNIWSHSLDIFEQSEVISEYLGKDFCRVYLACKRAENNEFNYHVSPLEYQWYLRTV